MENIEVNQIEKPKRPTFLTVLCILTFIGVGIAVISSISNFMMQNSALMQNAMQEGMKTNPFPDSGDMIAKSLYYATTIGIVNIICALVCLVGAILMFQLKKLGYYIYIVAEVAPVIISTILIGMPSGLLLATFIVSALLPVLFIILYGLNLKHMS